MLHGRSSRAFVFALLFLGISCSPSPAAGPQRSETPARERQPAGVFSHLKADRLESPGRLEREKPDEVVRIMKLKDGDVVADVGAGTGFYTRRVARAVGPSGKVYANEIQPEMLEKLQELAAEEGITNVVSVLGTETDPKLPAGQMDWILLVDTYHEFQQPEAMLEAMKKCLKPGGRVALVEKRLEGDTASQTGRAHRMSVEQVLAEWEPAGFTLLERIETLPMQHLFLFAVRGDPAGAPPADHREPAGVFGHENWEWLEREGREEAERPGVVLGAMRLKDGDVVAEIGSGSGFFARRLARAVGPSGKVYANDIQPEMLEKLEELAAAEKITNVVPVLGTETDPNLPERQMDWILLVDVYHEFQKPGEMLARLRQSLKPDGRIALVEYRLEGESASHIPVPHRMSVEQVLSEWEPAGFTLMETVETLPSQHLFLFSLRPDARPLP